MAPRVSVVMNAHNTTEFLAPALASAFQQTMDDLEVVIWDNASTDRAEAIARSFGDERVRYVFTEDKVSLYQARCDAVRACTGDYVAFLDCDDLWSPDKLERQLQAMEETGAASACSDFEHFTDGHWEKRVLMRAYAGNAVDLKAALVPYGVGMSSLIARRDVLLAVLPDAPPNWFFVEDLDIVSRLLATGPMAVVGLPLMQYRLHGSNASRDRAAYVREVNDWLADLATRSIDPRTRAAITAYHRTQSLRSQTAQLVASGQRIEAIATWSRMPWSLTKAKWIIGLMAPRSVAARHA